jgi:hypothetical protein
MAMVLPDFIISVLDTDGYRISWAKSNGVPSFNIRCKSIEKFYALTSNIERRGCGVAFRGVLG